MLPNPADVVNSSRVRVRVRACVPLPLLPLFRAQRRFGEARNDYVKLYTLRRVPLSSMSSVTDRQQTMLYSPTPADGEPEAVGPVVCVPSPPYRAPLLPFSIPYLAPHAAHCAQDAPMLLVSLAWCLYSSVCVDGCVWMGVGLFLCFSKRSGSMSDLALASISRIRCMSPTRSAGACVGP